MAKKTPKWQANLSNSTEWADCWEGWSGKAASYDEAVTLAAEHLYDCIGYDMDPVTYDNLVQYHLHVHA